MERLFGLPAHPLLVHLPVVTVPLLTAALVWTMLVSRSLRWTTTITAALAVVTGVGLLLASSSGEALIGAFEYLRDEPGVRSHIKSSESARLWGVITMFLTLGGWTAVRVRMHTQLSRKLGRVLLVLALAASVMTTTYTVKAGHSGTKARWFDIRFPDS